MSYSLKVVHRDREGARLQIEEYFRKNMRHFPSHVLAANAILALFDSLPALNVMGYELEARGGDHSDEILVRIRFIKQTTEGLYT